jgi:hypothetical protein
VHRSRIVTCLTGLVLAVLASPAAVAHTASAATAATASSYTARDVGFAEGGRPNDADLARRLDGIVAYVPGRSPFIRLDLDWWYVQPCRTCSLQWDNLDPVVDQATARGMRVLLVLAYGPPWTNGGHTTDKWFPTDDADWTTIVDSTVQHFGSRVQAYEVWNEPNLQQFADYATDRKARYWQLVRLAHQHIQSACSTCVVLAGGSGYGTPSSQVSNDNEPALWLDYAYRHGYSGDFDGVAHHPYPAWNSGFGPARPECQNRWWDMFGPPGEQSPCGELAYLHSVMVSHGDTAKRIWATEFGYPTSGATPVPRETIRDYLVQGVQMWRSLTYAGPLFLYSYRDACVDGTDPECNFGMVTRDFAPKDIVFSDVSDALADAPRPSLQTGQTLRRWASLLSLDHRFQLWLQEDGNLVLYLRYGPALWATGTLGGERLVNQTDGNLVLYRADGSVAWSSRTYGNGPSTLWQQQDGNLVLYRNSDAKPTWASGTVVR